MNAPDLDQCPPRSPRVRLGGFTILPRILDKIRAEIAGTAGEYKYKNPLDWHFLNYTGIDPDELKQEVARGGGDWEILQWVRAKTTPQRMEWEIAQWADWTANFTFHDADMREWFTDDIRRLNPARDDIRTVFDRLDLDDYASYGGQA